MERQWELHLMPGSNQDDEDIMPASENSDPLPSTGKDSDQFQSADGLQLSIGLYEHEHKQLHPNAKQRHGQVTLCLGRGATTSAAMLVPDDINPISHEGGAAKIEEQGGGGAEFAKQQAMEQLRVAAAEKAYAGHARELAKRQMEVAEAEFAIAKRIRERAQAELNRAQLLKEEATSRINATCMEITCQACRQQFQFQLPCRPTTAEENRNNAAIFIHAPAIPCTDENISQENFLSLQMMPEPDSYQQLPLNSTSTSKPQHS